MVLATSQQEFSDADWRAVAKADQSKKLAFDVSGVTAATTRTLTVPNASGTIALTSDLTSGYQPLDADLTSWAAITRASGFDTFVATPSSANFASLLTDETGTAGTVPILQTGTWTPSLGGNTTYTTQTGSYAKNGAIVLVTGRLTINVIGTGSTSSITGLPFTAGAVAAMYVGYFGTTVSSNVWLGGYILSGGTTIVMTGTTAAAASATDSFGTFKNGTDLIFVAVYRV